MPPGSNNQHKAKAHVLPLLLKTKQVFFCAIGVTGKDNKMKSSRYLFLNRFIIWLQQL